MFSGVKSSVDGVTLVHRHERQHRLAAEQVLVRDAVLVDLVALVEVAVLAGGELELGDAVAEPDGQHRADREDDDPVLPEVEPQPGPELVHGVVPHRAAQQPISRRCAATSEHLRATPDVGPFGRFRAPRDPGATCCRKRQR